MSVQALAYGTCKVTFSFQHMWVLGTLSGRLGSRQPLPTKASHQPRFKKKKEEEQQQPHMVASAHQGWWPLQPQKAKFILNYLWAFF